MGRKKDREVAIAIKNAVQDVENVELDDDMARNDVDDLVEDMGQDLLRQKRAAGACLFLAITRALRYFSSHALLWKNPDVRLPEIVLDRANCPS